MKKLFLLCLVCLTSLMLFANGSTESSAETYPSEHVTVVVPYNAGGGNDIVVRALVEAAKSSFPKGITVENRTGGGGAVGLIYGASAKADGYTLTNTPVETVTLPHTPTGAGLSASMFKPIISVNESYSCLTVNADSPYQTLEDFIEAAKTTTIQMGNSGIGAIWHLGAAALAQEAGIELKHIPFEGGSVCITELMGNHIDAITNSYDEVRPYVEAGSLRVLCVFAEERLSYAPDIPTAKELGYNVICSAWRGISVPADTPDDVADKLADILLQAAQSEEFQTLMSNANYPVVIMDREEFAARMAQDDEYYGALIEKLGLNK